MGKIGFLFSGQGAQYQGMGKELSEISKKARNVFEEADKIRKGTSEQCFFSDKEELSKTINTQPCLFCVDLAAAEALKENGIIPECIAGFSLGEIPALCFSEALDFKTAFSLVVKRSELMNKCAEKAKGAMYAILGIKSEEVISVCNKIDNCFAVNFNCETQTVVACEENPENEIKLKKAIKEKSGKAVKLSVSGAFHSPFMNEAAMELNEYLKDINLNDIMIPIYSNATAEIYKKSDKKLISNQVNYPVLWQNIIENMINQGVDTFIEVGAGKTLKNLVSKISKEVKTYNVEDIKSLTGTINAINNI